MGKIRVAIAGVGNCASALVQGVEYYRARGTEPGPGLMHPRIGEWSVGDIEFVAAFDVDRRKVGLPLERAIFARPNCARVFQGDLSPTGVTVCMGPIHDGVAPHMAEAPEEHAFREADLPPVDIASVLRESGAEVLVCYLPVGSEAAVRAYAEACLEAHVGMVNCVPVFIASDPQWARRFVDAGLPMVGDDVKSQLGATIVHRLLARAFTERGVQVKHTYQLNTGGNTDFLNMLERTRLRSKKKSKTDAVQSQFEHPLPERDIHVGPSDYVPWQEDNKVAFMRLEGRGFGDVPLELEVRLSVQDSPNSAAMVVDAIRFVALGLQHGLAGPLEAPCAWTMKSPPHQVPDSVARELTEAFLRAPSSLMDRTSVEPAL